MAKAKSVGDSSGSSILEGVTLSRTLPPLLPANFLSRSALVDSFTFEAPGTTLIVGPIGYGKTSLATEIAQRNSGRTFWYTMVDEDSPARFNSHVIQSVRNVIPDFAPWFNNQIQIEPMELIVKFSNELTTHKGDYIFIVDNRRTKDAQDFAVAAQMIRSLPRNLHLIQIRRNAPGSPVGELAPTGNFQTIGPSELRFSSNEVQQILAINGLSVDSDERNEIVKSAQGWPAAVQLIARGLSKGAQFDTSAEEISSSIEPLRLIVEEVVRGLTADEKNQLVPLSAVIEFTSELAQKILGQNFSQHQIDSWAFEGSLLSKNSLDEPIYKIHSLIREVLYSDLTKNKILLQNAHHSASEYYETVLNPTLAMEHAFFSQDFQRFEQLFRRGARTYSLTGRGRELLRWARYAGDESIEGQIKQQTVEVAGHLANLDYLRVEALLDSMRLQSRGTQLEQFIDRYASLIEIAVDFTFARFENLVCNVENALKNDELAEDLDHTDELYALRRLANYRFLVDDLEALEEVNLKARDLLAERFSQAGHIHQLAISAMTAFLQGYYINAQGAAKMAISLSEKMGLASYHYPLDVLYVNARCIYEFAQHEKALQEFQLLSEKAALYQQWSWHLFALSYIASDNAIRGNIEIALDSTRRCREKIALIEADNNLASIVDRSELFIRLMAKDIDRMKILVTTALPGRLVENARLHILDLEDKPWKDKNLSPMPERNPREKLYKLITDAHLAINEPEICNEIVKEALKIGSEVGAKETFLRESILFPSYIRISVESPTFYNEEIARGAMDRMQELNKLSSQVPELTKREIEIVRHLDSGKPITSIGATLHISHNTMKTHLKNIYRKLAVEGRNQAVEKAKSLGLI